jgi:ketopantoate reductase
MHFVVFGAGAVGAVLGALLAADGHRVSFWIRPEQRGRLRELSVQRVGGATMRTDAPACFTAGEAVPPSDWVLVCVRGEQLDAALREVALHLGPERRVAIAAVSLQRVTEQARAAGLIAPAFALHASFGSHAEPGRPSNYTWFPFASPTTVTPDGDRARLPTARELARALAHAGLPARSATSMSGTMRVLVAANSALALGWELCGWDLERLAHEPELRRLTGRAMHESARIALPARSVLRLVPAFGFELVVRALARFMGVKGREVWRHHGPKIRGQTDDIVRKLLDEAGAAALPTSALTDLFERWRTRPL